MKSHVTSHLVSVLLPVFNSGHYLTDALDSILNSSYENIEIIAIDDFSKDDSWKVLKLYKQLDKRVKAYRNVKHYGKALTLNRLLRKAKGQYVVMMDGKDMVYKFKFQKQVKFLEENSKVTAVGTQCTFINANGKKTEASSYPLESERIYHKPLHGLSFDFETVMINRLTLPKDALYFNPQSQILYSDMIMKLFPFGEVVNLPQLLQYRRAENPQRKTSLTKIPSLVKLWVKSIDSYDYRPSLKLLLSQFRLPGLSAN